MIWNRKRRALLEHFETRLQAEFADAALRAERTLDKRRSGWTLAVTAAWVAGAFAVLAGGLYAGKELRSRYKVKRRTPYDYYAHAGDQRTDLEFPVGI